MLLKVDPELASIVRPGWFVAEPVRVVGRDEAMDEPLRKSAAAMRAAVESAEITASVRSMYKRVGIDPTKTRPSSEALLRRVRRGDELPRINSLVDIINWCSLETQLPDVPDCMAMGNQIQQVLLNLLINARQAMTSGGRVLIRLEHDIASDTVDLVVRDSGSGIPADKLPHIFDPFFTTKSGPDETGMGGTGLGLASCRQIIEAHRGRIRVESTVGKGTQFTIKLPVAKAPMPVTMQPIAESSSVFT